MVMMNDTQKNARLYKAWMKKKLTFLRITHRYIRNGTIHGQNVNPRSNFCFWLISAFLN